MVVAKQKRNVLDELSKRVRGLLEDLDRVLSPQPQARPVPVRVPIPVPVRQPRRDVYR